MGKPFLRSMNRKFTLIELMVILSIITTLVAILVPALNRAAQVTREITCRENLRGIGLMMTYYANDNEGKLPNPHKSIVAYDARWLNALYYYSEGNKDTFICPDAPDNIKTLYDSGGNFYGKGSYGMNVYLYMRPPLSSPPGNFTDGSGNWLFLRTSLITQPSQCVIVADSENPSNNPSVNSQLLYPYSGMGTTSTWGGKLSNRHDGEGYYLWADGHVSALEMEEAAANANRWFGPQGW